MLQTPDDFVPLLSAQDSDSPLSFVFRGNELLLSEEATLPEPGALRWLGLPAARYQPVGLLGGRYCRAAWIEADTEALPAHEWRGLRSLFGVFDESLMAVAGRAFQIADWARSHRFCGVCGSATQQVEGERCMRCPSCGHSAYPRISPAMMVLVKHGDAILLARHTHSPAAFYTALAGFLEAGESAEEAVHREVFEEVGLKVKDVRYFGSQPWPFPHSLMIAFTAEYVSGEIRVDEKEIAEARWFGPGDEMPRIPHAVSIAASLIAANRK